MMWSLDDYFSAIMRFPIVVDILETSQQLVY